MIKTKEDLKYYLLCDKIAIGKDYDKPKIIGDKIWKFQILYRKVEFYYNNKDKSIYKALYLVHKICFKLLCDKWNSEFPVNVIQEGLVIFHGQGIIINGNSRIGKNFSISRGCVVGQSNNKYPVIGDNVEMMIDSKVLGGIYIPNNTSIAAGAICVKQIDEEGVTLGGVPAKIISSKQNKYVLEKSQRLKKILK